MEYISPGGSLDFLFDATAWLAVGEEVSTATWTLEAGVTGAGQIDTITGSTLQITAGAFAGKVCKVVVEITTNAANTFRRTWFITIQEELA